METKHYKATFLDEVLGTKPTDENVHETFIAAKREEGVAQDELDAEARALKEVERLEKGATIFARNADGKPILWDYQIKGFLKEAAKALKRDSDSAWAHKDLRAYKSIIDCNVFIGPREIVLHLPDGAKMGRCERPLRALTMQGERVALAASEAAPAGTWIEFNVATIGCGKVLAAALKEAFEYAKFKFMGAWRSSGKGRAKVEEVKA